MLSLLQHIWCVTLLTWLQFYVHIVARSSG